METYSPSAILFCGSFGMGIFVQIDMVSLGKQLTLLQTNSNIQ